MYLHFSSKWMYEPTVGTTASEESFATRVVGSDGTLQRATWVDVGFISIGTFWGPLVVSNGYATHVAASYVWGPQTRLILRGGAQQVVNSLTYHADITAPTADHLVTFERNTVNVTHHLEGEGDDKKVVTTMHTLNAPALRSGTVTNFTLYVNYATTYPYPNPTNGSALVRSAMTGTVGAVGSGADLEMEQPNVVTGDAVRIHALVFNTPCCYKNT